MISTTHRTHHNHYYTHNPSQSLQHTQSITISTTHTIHLDLYSTHNPSRSLPYTIHHNLYNTHNPSQSLQHTQSIIISTVHTICSFQSPLGRERREGEDRVHINPDALQATCVHTQFGWGIRKPTITHLPQITRKLQSWLLAFRNKIQTHKRSK